MGVSLISLAGRDHEPSEECLCYLVALKKEILVKMVGNEKIGQSVQDIDPETTRKTRIRLYMVVSDSPCQILLIMLHIFDAILQAP